MHSVAEPIDQYAVNIKGEVCYYEQTKSGTGTAFYV